MSSSIIDTLGKSRFSAKSSPTNEAPLDHQTIIEASWERCRNYGLDPSSEPVIERLGTGDVSSLKEEHHFLVETTNNEVLPYYENILSNSQCMIMLTDSRGQMLNSWGDRRFLNKQQKAFFEPGTYWGENVNGTNAIGTAMELGHAVQVQKDEHFLKSNRFMVGSAAPIFNVNHDLLGVIDVSSDTYLPHSHTLGMVKLMSQAVENRLIVKMFSAENYLLSFNTNIDNIDSQWAGLIVFNEDGTIISANRRAELLLGYDLALTNISDIFDFPLLELKNHPESMPIKLPALGRFQMHGVLKRPTEKAIQAIDFRQRLIKKRKKEDTQITLDRYSFGDPRIEHCIKQAKKIIEKDIPLLIFGETGVGKEVFVNALHEYSSRKTYPLVAVNCAAIPAELVESELFGYEKGAFTGASNKGATGLIRKAHKGTLFLDEIGEMPLKVQARLLRVLQERKVYPLGSTESYPVDIKLISATNRSLREDVEKGLFRQDLYYRVSGLNIELPALRERTDQVELFKEIYNLYRTNEQPEHLPENIIELFQKHPWPGNIRQLVSVLQIALAMAENQPIQPTDLPSDFFEDIGSTTVSTSRPLQGEFKPEPASAPQPAETNATDRNDVVAVYNANQGNISKTAKALNISRNTLYKRLRELGIK
ncbi:sigma-54-dependent Fis family transcriptional regulator [Reinekea marina]|uniref:Sigma-54-dependent Fis family transcriptional regulator n=1 Tax=Reinekea marina TaxID=1310421 RepID=A0ABV7WQY9_9GAMM|nr:sigma-54-dependent Fis family transcriptional regulator [Reinekea marina]MDN3647848.1 sigma-54-dependent Fis family transcriptional regulator [Reinekea marina]